MSTFYKKLVSYIIVAVAGFITTCVIEHNTTSDKWKPSVSLNHVATWLRTTFYELGEYAGVAAGWLVIIKDELYNYLIEFWPSVHAVLLPLMKIVMSWLWFFKGMFWQVMVMGSSAFRKVWRATPELQLGVLKSVGVSPVNLLLCLFGFFLLVLMLWSGLLMLVQRPSVQQRFPWLSTQIISIDQRLQNSSVLPVSHEE